MDEKWKGAYTPVIMSTPGVKCKLTGILFQRWG